MQLTTTSNLARELNIAGNTVLTYAKKIKAGTKLSYKKNASFVYTEKEAQKIREHFKK